MKSERQRAINRADEYFSKYIRLRDRKTGNICKCITCGKMGHWQKMDAGHFQTRNNLETRWDERNVNTQCPKCNRFLGGRQFEHGLAIDKKYGEGTSLDLLQKSKELCKLTTEEIRAIADKYREKIKQWI